MISAEIILDSVSPEGHRLTTMKLRYPKFIHGEFMTHRVFSRNASSSRAVPTAKLIEEVRSNARAAPVWWGANQGGMQADVELSDEPIVKYPPEVREETEFRSPRRFAQDAWMRAAFSAAKNAEELVHAGAHKQIVNRVLEPFSHINVVVSATEYDNFFGLRLDRAAQPEMRALAEAMWAAREASEPTTLRPGDWHLPFVRVEDVPALLEEHDRQFRQQHCARNDSLHDLHVKVSVARCARVSYESFETGRRSTVEEDLRLYDRLLGAQPLHASPAEHQATPDRLLNNNVHDYVYWEHGDQHGNFKGFRQFRKMLAGEAAAPLPNSYQPNGNRL